jgi:putative ABC transport system ATP-binding protein
MTDPVPAQAIVTCRDLGRVYGEGEAAVHALRGVTLDFPAGQFTAIMGPSGSGKSTLMHLLAGLDKPSTGSVTVDGREIGGLNDKALTNLRRDRLGFIFQSFNLIPVLSAEENILLPLTLAGARPDREWVDRLIDSVDLRDRLSHRPAELSGGQQQRVAVARALVHRPAVVFADEPTGQPRYACLGGGAGAAAARRRRPRPDRGHGHPRRAGGLGRRPHRRPARRRRGPRRRWGEHRGRARPHEVRGG